eukprot:gene2227-3253_t
MWLHREDLWKGCEQLIIPALECLPCTLQSDFKTLLIAAKKTSGNLWCMCRVPKDGPKELPLKDALETLPWHPTAAEPEPKSGVKTTCHMGEKEMGIYATRWKEARDVVKFIDGSLHRLGFTLGKCDLCEALTDQATLDLLNWNLIVLSMSMGRKSCGEVVRKGEIIVDSDDEAGDTNIDYFAKCKTFRYAARDAFN